MNKNLLDVVSKAIEIARWAPSSHNCQPWKVITLKDAGKQYDALFNQPLKSNELLCCLALDKKRQLSALPSLQFEMYISCGLFLGLFWLAVSQQKAHCRFHWLCDAELNLSWLQVASEHESELLVAMVITAENRDQIRNNQVSTVESKLNHLLDMVSTRRTFRGLFEEKSFDHEMIENLLSRRWPQAITGGEALVQLEQNSGFIRNTTKLIAKYAALDFSSYRAWKETYRYIRFDQQAGTEDGFYLQSLFGPMPKRKIKFYEYMLSPLVMQALRLVNVPHYMAKELSKLVEKSAQLLVIKMNTERLSKRNLVMTGARLMEVWLQAHHAGVAFHPLSVLLQHDEPREALQRLLQCHNERIVFVARVGYIKTPEDISPRRTAQSIHTAVYS
ncbi:nitroreductase family protein [Zooshikella sp. RANM57]|uniref:nitroreductase family protein n=1 Tax=Zooshikella sp. RANM57 TaxID=3425863 RepID=UPI003D6F77B4